MQSHSLPTRRSSDVLLWSDWRRKWSRHLGEIWRASGLWSTVPQWKNEFIFSAVAPVKFPLRVKTAVWVFLEIWGPPSGSASWACAHKTHWMIWAWCYLLPSWQWCVYKPHQGGNCSKADEVDISTCCFLWHQKKKKKSKFPFIQIEISEDNVVFCYLGP